MGWERFQASSCIVAEPAQPPGLAGRQSEPRANKYIDMFSALPSIRTCFLGNLIVDLAQPPRGHNRFAFCVSTRLWKLPFDQWLS